ncbi:MAG: type II restriction endonuclease [Kiritimatiellia bacterium]
MRSFDTWLAEFRDSISSYDYYIDFPKVVANAKTWKPELHLLNSLIGSPDIENDFRRLLGKYPQILQVIPILLAKREAEIYAKDDEGGGLYRFDTTSQTIDEYCVFMRKTGLFDLIAKHLVNSLYDYVVGVETGLDSNGRKNRGGHQMEDLVEGFLRRAGVRYFKEMNSDVLMKRFGVDISALTHRGKTLKRFDFVVQTKSCVYAIETNFYGSGGSKLNETARSYKMLALASKNIPNFKFVWFTDGAGWRSAKQNLRETFDVLPTIYNIKDLESGIAQTLFA